MKIASGWYPDPKDASRTRWWNGEDWTSHVRDERSRSVSQDVYSPTPIAVLPERPVFEALTYDNAVRQRRRSDSAPISLPPELMQTTPATKPTKASPVVVVPLRREKLEVVQERAINLNGSYSYSQVRLMQRAGEIDKLQAKQLRKSIDRVQSNTNYISFGGLAFTLYLLMYPTMGAFIFFGISGMIGDAIGVLNSLDFSGIGEASKSITKLEKLGDFGAKYAIIKTSFITAMTLSALIPLVAGIVGAFWKRGRVWAVATITLAALLNPAVVTAGMATNPTWLLLLF